MSFQLPVRSPLPLRAVLAGLAGLLREATGPEDFLRAALLRHFGARDVLFLDSGTSALALSLGGALSEGGGRSVALPAYGCFDIATAAEAALARVVLYDTDPATLGPESKSFRRALDSNPAAVVLAHLYGVPVDVPGFAAMARSAGSLLVEDAAQGSGAWLQGRPLGTFGDVSVLSFGRGKGVTGGGGGALLAFSERGSRIVEAARAALQKGRGGLRETVLLCAQWALGRRGLYRLPASLPFLRLGETIYRPPHPPRGASNTSLLVLARTWPLAEGEAELRRRNAERLLARHGPALQRITPPRDARPGYLRLPLLASPRTRAVVAAHETRRLGIVAGYPMPISELPGLRARWMNQEERLPGAHRLAAELVTIPTHGGLLEGDLRRIERWMDRANGAAA